jgi:peptide-methionine (S)-S-oxide reductase
MNKLKSLFLVVMFAGSALALPAQAEIRSAVFAGGCFWCVESDFDKVDGVLSTTSGFIGGHTKNPTYKQVSAGGTGYAEAVKVRYDTDRVTFRQLVDHFWYTIDPTVKDRQFCDHGHQYRTGIFYMDEEQHQAALASKAAIEKSKTFAAPIVTEITKAGEFYPAERYHQNFYKKNPLRYKFYRWNCGRDQRLEELWGDKAASH